MLDLEGGEKGEWGFKALKQMIKINFKLVCIMYLLLYNYKYELKIRIGINSQTWNN